MKIFFLPRTIPLPSPERLEPERKPKTAFLFGSVPSNIFALLKFNRTNRQKSPNQKMRSRLLLARIRLIFISPLNAIYIFSL